MSITKSLSVLRVFGSWSNVYAQLPTCTCSVLAKRAGHLQQLTAEAKSSKERVYGYVYVRLD